jgi:hypothetical protein
MDKIRFCLTKFFHPHWFVVTLCSHDDTVSRVGAWARCIIYSCAVDGNVAVDWADGSYTDIPFKDVACFLVAR